MLSWLLEAELLNHCGEEDEQSVPKQFNPTF